MTIIMRKLFKNYSKIIQKKINIILKRKKHHMEPFPHELEEEYREAFNYFDKEKIGRIQPKDVGALMRSVGEILNDQQIQTLFSGGIDFNNFLNYFKNKWEKSQAYETLVNAFSFFDYEGNGYVRGDILRRVLTYIGEPLSDSEVNDLIKEAGGDPINYKQFAAIMLSKGT